MDIRTNLLQSLTEQKVRGWNGPLPFYMTYNDYFAPKNETEILRDLEYLQQLYPADIQWYRRRISEFVDKIDYEGSMIYDEYPDSYSIRAFAGTIQNHLNREDDNPPTEGIIQILLLEEIYKRRHRNREKYEQFKRFI